MEDLEEMLRELSEKYKNSKSVEVYEEDLEWWFKIIDDLREENKKLKDDIKKWEDRWMVRLAEIYVMPTRELTTAIAKNEWFSSWYDTVKKQMLHELWFDRLDMQDLLKENKKLKEELEEIKNDLDHRDSFFSIMRDVLANEGIDNTQLAAILYCVVHEECGDYDLSKKELKIAKEFWGRKYV